MFFLTTRHPDHLDRNRCVGFFTTQDEAELVLRKDVNGYLAECGWYTEAVVEEFEPGLYPKGEVVSWWRWEGGWHDGNWQRVGRPAESEHVINFALG